MEGAGPVVEAAGAFAPPGAGFCDGVVGAVVAEAVAAPTGAMGGTAATGAGAGDDSGEGSNGVGTRVGLMAEGWESDMMFDAMMVELELASALACFLRCRCEWLDATGYFLELVVFAT